MVSIRAAGRPAALAAAAGAPKIASISMGLPARRSSNMLGL